MIRITNATGNPLTESALSSQEFYEVYDYAHRTGQRKGEYVLQTGELVNWKKILKRKKIRKTFDLTLDKNQK
jgi:hypothetical protein